MGAPSPCPGGLQCGRMQRDFCLGSRGRHSAECTSCPPSSSHPVTLCSDAGQRSRRRIGVDQTTPRREGELGGARQGVACRSTSSTGQYRTAWAPRPSPSSCSYPPWLRHPSHSNPAVTKQDWHTGGHNYAHALTSSHLVYPLVSTHTRQHIHTHALPYRHRPMCLSYTTGLGVEVRCTHVHLLCCGCFIHSCDAVSFSFSRQQMSW